MKISTMRLFAVLIVCAAAAVFLDMLRMAPAAPFPDTAPSRLFQEGTPSTARITIPVLMYHYIRSIKHPELDELGYRLSVAPADFEKQLQYLFQEGYESITPAELDDALQGKKKFPGGKPILITFDDGYEDFYTAAFPLLKKYDLQATIFVVPGFLSESGGPYLTWAQVKELDHSGLVTVASHTLHHVDLTESRVANKEITESRQVLQKFLGHPVDTFAYPGGTFDKHVEAIVMAAGYRLAFTAKPGISHAYAERFEISRIRIPGGMGIKKFMDAINGRAALTRQACPSLPGGALSSGAGSLCVQAPVHHKGSA